MDEPESRGLLQLAANDELDNLTFVVNCNLQRLDGPVRGNGKIIQELEAFFRGAGWNVIKVVWGRGWDPLLAADRDGALVHVMNSTSDGDYQTFRANDGAYVREHFFGRDPRTRAMVENWSDDDVWWKLKRGGHDYRKVYAAYLAAMNHTGQPTVILAKTIKGYSLGSHFAGRNATHQMKKMTLDDLKAFRDDMRIPISDEQLEADPYRPPYYHPGKDHKAIQYMLERRAALGGDVPSRRVQHDSLKLPGEDAYKQLKKGSGKQEIATTMAFVRLLKDLMRDKEFGSRVVPIIPDEARTFGMDSFFPTIKIYNPHGQNYTPVDAELMLAYRESEKGQILHLGIDEAGSMAAFTAVGTSYATHGEPMVPIYVFYSMFGFQRTADSIWAATDQMTRGFLIGATAGRTTLTGEGLQHADGHSPLLASTNPAVVSYDPAYGYEIAHIVQEGLRRMYGDNPENVIYYLTVYNEPLVQPKEPENVDAEGILRGMYLLSPAKTDGWEHQPARAQLLASGVGVPWALEAQQLLAEDFGVAADVWSVTSWTELRRDGMDCDEQEFLRPGGRAAGAVGDPEAAGRTGSGAGGLGLHARRAGPDRAVRAGRLHVPRRRRVRLLRHPRGGAALLPHRRAVARRADAPAAGQAGRRPRGLRRQGRREVPPPRRDGRYQRQRRRRVLGPRPKGRLPVGVPTGTAPSQSAVSRRRLLLTDQLGDGAGDPGLEVEDLGPRRRDPDLHHRVVQAAHPRHPLVVLVVADVLVARLEVPLRDALDLLHGRRTPDQQDLRREVVGVDRHCHARVALEGAHLGRPRHGPHQQCGPVPLPADRDHPRSAVQAGVREPRRGRRVQELLRDRVGEQGLQLGVGHRRGHASASVGSRTGASRSRVSFQPAST